MLTPPQCPSLTSLKLIEPACAKLYRDIFTLHHNNVSIRFESGYEKSSLVTYLLGTSLTCILTIVDIILPMHSANPIGEVGCFSDLPGALRFSTASMHRVSKIIEQNCSNETVGQGVPCPIPASFGLPETRFPAMSRAIASAPLTACAGSHSKALFCLIYIASWPPRTCTGDPPYFLSRALLLLHYGQPRIFV